MDSSTYGLGLKMPLLRNEADSTKSKYSDVRKERFQCIRLWFVTYLIHSADDINDCFCRSHFRPCLNFVFIYSGFKKAHDSQRVV